MKIDLMFMYPFSSQLYLPGHDMKKAAKAITLGVDCICLDCEDAVAANRKDDARHGIVKILQEMDFGKSEVAVRINLPESEAALKDIETIFTSTRLPDTIVVPKVDTLANLEWVSVYMRRCY